MCGGRSSILHYGPLIETNYLYAPTPNGQKPECVDKQKQYPPYGFNELVCTWMRVNERLRESRSIEV